MKKNEIKTAVKSEGIKHDERSKWERVKSRRVQRQMTQGEATEQGAGGELVQQSDVGHSGFLANGRGIWTVSLTDLAVAEMYWTTISRLVLRSFSRRGALRSSFRFMSSWRRKQKGERFSHGREPADEQSHEWMEVTFHNRSVLLLVVFALN